MADLILSTDLDTFLGAANFAAARTALGVPGLATANTFTAVGAVSAPAVSFTGAPFTGGDATTTKPLLLIEPTGTTSNAWTTSGTMLGVNAASAFTGHLLSLRTNSTSAFSVDRTGQCTFQTSMGGPSFYESTGNSFYANSAVGGVQTKSAGFFGWSVDATAFGTADTALFRLGAANIRQGKVPSATPIAQTLTIGEASRPGTDSNVAGANGTIQSGLGTGTGTVSSLIFQTPTTVGAGSAVQTYATRLTLSSAGAVVVGNLTTDSNVFLGASQRIAWAGQSRIISPADGQLQLTNTAQTDFSRLQFGGTTASFPAIKRNAAALNFRVADDTADCAVTALSYQSAAPAGGTSGVWKLGVAATVTPTSPNRTIEVDIGGTIYYLAAKTTNN